MSNINLRIKELRDHFANGNNSDFAIMIESSEANIRNYIKSTEPRFGVLVNICEKLEVNSDWLLLGKGEMKKSPTSQEARDLNDSFVETKSNIHSMDFIKILQEQNIAYNAIQTIQDRKIEILTKNMENLKGELNQIKSLIKH